MSPIARSFLSYLALTTATLGCSGGSTPPGDMPNPGKGGNNGMGGNKTMPGKAGNTGTSTGGAIGTAGAKGSPGAGGAGGSTKPAPMGAGGMKMHGMKPGTSGSGGTVVVGIPTPGMPPTPFPGGGPSGSAPLKPGCTPASARECPSASGTCATSSTSDPKGTTSGTICFFGPITTTTTTTPAPRAATIEYLHETAGGQEYYRFRITFDPAFVDNTYGVNAIGWTQKGHTFKDLVGSDHAELSLFDGTLALTSMFDLDYITASTGATCEYSALGVSGGEGKMLVGDAKFILASTTSLDRDLNGCGYCKSSACGGDCTIDSPATDLKYTPNTAAPNWDYRVVYEAWVDAAAFAGKGFGGASITFVHASPSKASSNTISVTPRPCNGDGCPEGQHAIEGAEGQTCSTGCPEGTFEVKQASGYWTCSPCPNGERPEYDEVGNVSCNPCPTGTTIQLEAEGYTCINIS